MAEDAQERTPLERIPASPEEVLDLVRQKSAELRRLEAQRVQARDHLGQAITLAHDRGYSWVDISRAAEFMHASTARQFALPLVRPADLSLEGVSVSAAALALGVARKTVYAWIASGRLTATEDPSGRLRVMLPNPD